MKCIFGYLYVTNSVLWKVVCYEMLIKIRINWNMRTLLILKTENGLIGIRTWQEVSLDIWHMTKMHFWQLIRWCASKYIMSGGFWRKGQCFGNYNLCFQLRKLYQIFLKQDIVSWFFVHSSWKPHKKCQLYYFSLISVDIFLFQLLH